MPYFLKYALNSNQKKKKKREKDKTRFSLQQTVVKHRDLHNKDRSEHLTTTQ